MGIRREATNSPVAQGEDEQITYIVDFAPWGASTSLPVTSPVVKLFDQDGADVSGTKLSGSPTVVASTKVKTPKVISLVANIQYRLEVKGVFDSDTFEAWSYIKGEK